MSRNAWARRSAGGSPTAPVTATRGGTGRRWSDAALLLACALTLSAPQFAAARQDDEEGPSAAEVARAAELTNQVQAAVDARDPEAYLAIRSEFQASAAEDYLKVDYDKIFVEPGFGLDPAQRLAYVDAWLPDHGPNGRGLALLALEGADAARLLKRWSDATRLLDVARTDFDVQDPDHLKQYAYYIEPHIWYHDIAGVLYRQMGAFDVAARHLELQRDWVDKFGASEGHDPVQAQVLAINAMFNRVMLASARKDVDSVLQEEQEIEAVYEAYRLAHGEADAEQQAAIDTFLDRQRDRLSMIVGLTALEHSRRSGQPYDLARTRFEELAGSAQLAYTRLKCRLGLVQLALLGGDGEAARVAFEAFDRAWAEAPDFDGPATEFREPVAALRGWWATEHGDAQQQRDALDEVERHLDLMMGSWRAAPIEEEGIGYASYYDSRLLFDARYRLRRSVHPQENWAEATLDQILAFESCATLAREVGADGLDRDRVGEALLRPGHGVLIFYPGYHRSWVLAWDGAGVVGEEVAPDFLLEDEFWELSLAVQDAVAARVATTPDLEAAIARCSSSLLPTSIRQRLASWKSVAVVGGSGRWIPFELLEGEGGEPLGLTHALSYLPSLPIGAYLFGRDHGLPAGLLPDMSLVAGTAIDAEVLAAEGVANLGPFEESILALTSGYGSYAKGCPGTQATPERARELLAKAQVGHVFAHGLYSPERVRPSGILLAGEDGRVYTDTLEDWTWPDLTILSACGVHRGPLRLGDDGRALLAGAVLRGGARSVLLPYVDVELSEHLELMNAFHAALLEQGLPPEEALLAARREVGTGLQRFLVHLVGLGDVPVVAAPVPAPASRGWIVTLVVLVALAGVAGLPLVLRRRRAQG